ncbi:hypothetical protein SISSUDRAFT_1066248 [Sistotremastrum suecicum HHB10207 ss-3]|uniref:Nucleoplasmin-like domain-containing protein n=1 Tax=Sistotremastrum suecicum HHB10207 ss-3 TaxID=1314776 RepID=A0A165YIP9_9AGAM|nr:hypothetical protein SISSUDRAFT_1066248 [Sistotremastrum suecicum HHB10207 ss-3]
MATLAFTSLAVCAIELSPSLPFRFKPLNNLRLTNASISETRNLDWTAVYIEHLDTIQLQSKRSTSSRRETCICWLKPGEEMNTTFDIVLSPEEEVTFSLRNSHGGREVSAVTLAGYYFHSELNGQFLSQTSLHGPPQSTLSTAPVPTSARDNPHGQYLSSLSTAPAPTSTRGEPQHVYTQKTVPSANTKQKAVPSPKETSGFKQGEISNIRDDREAAGKNASRKRKINEEHSEQKATNQRQQRQPEVSGPQAGINHAAKRNRSYSTDSREQPPPKRPRENKTTKPSEPIKAPPKARPVTRPPPPEPPQGAANSTVTAPLFYPEDSAGDNISGANIEQDVETLEHDRNLGPSICERDSALVDATDQHSAEVSSEGDPVDAIEASSIMGIGDHSGSEGIL